MTASRTDIDVRRERSDTRSLGQPAVLAGVLAALGNSLGDRQPRTTPVPFLLWIGLVAVVTGVIVLALTRPISRMMKGVR